MLPFCFSRESGPDERWKKQIRTDVQEGPGKKVADNATAAACGPDPRPARAAGRGRRLQQPTGRFALREHPHQAGDSDTPSTTSTLTFITILLPLPSFLFLFHIHGCFPFVSRHINCDCASFYPQTYFWWCLVYWSYQDYLIFLR